METLDTAKACFMLEDDLLNFILDGEGEEEEDPTIFKGASASASASSSSVETSSAAAAAAFGRGALGGSFHEFVEEELEWLSNKDAFPTVETCFGILADNPELILNHHSPVPLLENSSSSSNSNTNSNDSSVASYCDSLRVPTNYPVRTRSKRRRRAGFGHLPSQHSCLNQVNFKNKQELSFSLLPLPTITDSGTSMGRRCLHCQADKTPQWRAGPMGPKTLCNACGVRYKSGRLLPEYRPASSPTFSTILHSNSHRKVVEMRKKKHLAEVEGIPVDVACGYRVGQ